MKAHAFFVFFSVCTLILGAESKVAPRSAGLMCGAGVPVYNCFVDPCQLSVCHVDGATCRANYCGGCNADWYDANGHRLPLC